MSLTIKFYVTRTDFSNKKERYVHIFELDDLNDFIVRYVRYYDNEGIVDYIGLDLYCRYFIPKYNSVFMNEDIYITSGKLVKTHNIKEEYYREGLIKISTRNENDDKKIFTDYNDFINHMNEIIKIIK